MTIDTSSRGFDWNKSTVEEKLEFLFRWCENLENTDINLGRGLSSKTREIQASLKECREAALDQSSA
jgi:hypothetical protein